ncbi:MAG TPA: gliding motility-associated C-terminal domain-containing protein [Flavobacteriales bacterium]
MGLGCTVRVFAQNLVPNPGFEVVVDCPGDAAALELAAPWTIPTVGSTDLFHSCSGPSCPEYFPFVCVPTNWVGDQLPRTGEGYAGFFALWEQTTAYREYMQVPLAEPLAAGTTYHVSFHLSLADASGRATNSVGAYFSDGPIAQGDVSPFSQYTPQVSAGSVIVDKTGWVEVSGCFMANGGEQYLTIGNFNTYANSSFITVPGGSTGHCYYYVDDVSVIESTASAEDIWEEPVLLCEGDSLLVDISAWGADVSWENGSTGPERIIHGPGTYWVELMSDCGTWSDTLYVMPIDPEAPDLGPDTTICTGSTILLEVLSGADEVLWQDGTISAQYMVSEAGTYWAEVQGACPSRDSIYIAEEPCPVPPSGSDLVMPNVFSPDHDGMNDLFRPVRWSGITGYALRIYNRWGQLLFTTSSLLSGWDGTANGSICPEGTYFWEVTHGDAQGGLQRLAGHLTLLR